MGSVLLEFTEDISILDEQVEYVTGIDIQDEKEKYDKYRYTEEKDSIYNHCMKAIFRSLEFGILTSFVLYCLFCIHH